MNHLFISLIFFLVLGIGTAKAEDVSQKIEYLNTEISTLKTKQERLNNKIDILSSKNTKKEAQIYNLQFENKRLVSKVDSLYKEYHKLAGNQKADKSELIDSINQTNNKVLTTENVISSRTLWGICGLFVLIIAIIAIVLVFFKKLRLGTSSIDDVRKAQEALQTAQIKMQEESVKLDDKLLELFDKQISATPKVVDTGKPDHSLALKVADEIVRIELNMSRMDTSIKGYKQLAKAVERIKDNFKANGYEIVDMLGKPYNDGMKVTANFVADENIEEGKQIITGITKPQINYNGQMIQAAQITVSQNI